MQRTIIRGNVIVDTSPPLRIAFTVYGQAAPAGSKRHVGGHRIIDASRRSAPWKEHVSAAAADAILEAGTFAGVVERLVLLDGPLAVTMTFYVPRPKGHYSQGRIATATYGSLRRGAPVWPTTRPDVLKLARAVEDACTGIIWRDDAQIVRETLVKRYGEPARVEIVVTEA